MIANALIEAGFWSNGPVRVALLVSFVVAMICAGAGVLVVMRAQSFAGHALSDVAGAGGAGAAVLGAPALAGFALGSLVGAVSIEAIGERRVAQRDVATGIVLGAATGAAALFFHIAAVSGSSASATQDVLFGSIFTLDPSTTWWVVGLGALSMLLLGLIARTLVLTTLSADLAVARGARARGVELVFVVVLAVVVALSSLAVGAVLSTALLIGPAAAAVRVARSTVTSFALAAVLGIVASFVGLLVSYDSYAWSSSHRVVPASSAIVGVVIVEFVICRLVARRR